MMKLLCSLLVVCCLVSAINYQELVPLPPNLKNQNGFTYLKLSTMLNLFGAPCALNPQCSSVTNPNLASKIETRKIGRFTFTGMKMALDALSRALDDVSRSDPALYAALGSSGMLCCRAIRGSTTSFSNHAWGAAVDINIQGTLDPRGDGKCQRGLLMLYPYMAKQGFYWAGGYSGASEDSMHFEIADEVMRNWGSSGSWGTCTSTSGVDGTCIDVGQCKLATESGKCPGPTNIKCCFSDGVVPAPPPTYKCVTATALNIRSGACTTFGILSTANMGDALLVVDPAIVAGCGNNWIQVRKSGITGFVAVDFTEPCVPLGNYDAINSTIGDDFANGTIYDNDGDVDFVYDETATAGAATFFSLWFLFVVIVMSVVY